MRRESHSFVWFMLVGAYGVAAAGAVGAVWSAAVARDPLLVLVSSLILIQGILLSVILGGVVRHGVGPRPTLSLVVIVVTILVLGCLLFLRQR